MKATMKEEGYSFVRWSDPGTAIFRNADGGLELFAARKHHASWGFSWRGTDWEFCTSAPIQQSTLDVWADIIESQGKA